MSDARLGGRGNGPARQAALLQMQRTAGNRAARAFVQRASGASAARPRPAAPSPRFAVQRAEAAALTDEQDQSYHRIAGDITGVFEGGKADTLNLYDSGIISYGKHQATLASGSLYTILKEYTDKSQSDTAKQIAGYLDRVQQKDATLKNDTTFIDLLKAAAKETEMSAAQETVFTTSYWNPAKKAAQQAGITSALGYAMFYDTNIQGGMNDVLNRTKTRLGGVVGDTVNGKQITEQDFLHAYNEERTKRIEEIIAKDNQKAEKLNKEAEDLEAQIAAADPDTAKTLKQQADAKRAAAKVQEATAKALDVAAHKARIPSLQTLVDSGDLALHGDKDGIVHLSGMKGSQVTGLPQTTPAAGSAPSTTGSATPASGSQAAGGQAGATGGSLLDWAANAAHTVGTEVRELASEAVTWVEGLFSSTAASTPTTGPAGTPATAPAGGTASAASAQPAAAANPLAQAIASGERNETKLTDLVFYSRHPDLKGKDIGPAQQALISEWKKIRDTEVRPGIQAAQTAVSPAS